MTNIPAAKFKQQLGYCQEKVAELEEQLAEARTEIARFRGAPRPPEPCQKGTYEVCSITSNI